MEERKVKIWHKFAEEKPSKDGLYVAISPYSVCDGHWVSTILYYVKSGLFNWRGEGEDTSINVEYWAEVEDVVESAIKNI